MSTTVKYKGTTIATITNTTKTLQTEGKYCEGNIEITDSGGGGGGATLETLSLSITPSSSAQSWTENPGQGYDGFDKVNVSVAAIPARTTYSVTQSLTNVSSSTNIAEVDPNGTFFCELTPAAGYVISTITVTMGGVDITDQVFMASLDSKTITANGTYDPEDDDLGGYSEVVVSVPNSYSVSDEGKVVSSGALVSQTSATYTTNDTYDTTLIDSVTVNVSGSSPSLGTKVITANDTYYAQDDNYDGYSQVSVSVANSYSASDEGKVVSNGALVSQSSDTVTQNGTVDTTLINSLLVNVSGGDGGKSQTGTFTGTGTNSVTISCTFIPDLIYVRGNTTQANNIVGCNTVIIIRDTCAISRYDSSSSNTNTTYAAEYGITGLNDNVSLDYNYKATVQNNQVTITSKTSAARVYFSSALTYQYMFAKWTT